MQELIQNWRLALVRSREVREGFFATRTSEILSGAKRVIPAAVPGNFELDMQKAGLLPDPYYADNIIAHRELEDMHLWYFASFDLREEKGMDAFLEFGGIDTVSEIYIDGKLLGETENMLIPHTFSLAGIPAGSHEVVVHITPSLHAARRTPVPATALTQEYNGDSLVLRKAPYMYGWDIMPRCVSGGLWKEVKVIYRPKTRIEEYYLTVHALYRDWAELRLATRITTDLDLLTDLTVKIEGRSGDSTFSYAFQPFGSYTVRRFTMGAPKLWMPKNYGEANLYDVTLTLEKGGEVMDAIRFRYGIKVVELERTSLAGEDGEFVFRVNGQKIFCMGTNWVPLDAFPSRHEELLPRALGMLDEIGCNMVRCWGGSTYPSEAFYDFCDEHGILVWQDFAMGCGHYPDDARLGRLLEEEAEKVIKTFRNHASLALWAGDNECDAFAMFSLNVIVNGRNVPLVDPNENEMTRGVLRRAVRNHDYFHPYLPSSPYVDREAFLHAEAKRSEDHLWGPRDYYKGNFYATAPAHFASEIGYHGCPSPATLRKFIPEEHLLQYGDEKECRDRMWLTHAAAMEPIPGAAYTYRIPLMSRQVGTLFGEVPRDLWRYALASQISQAEAKKFFVEHFRMAKWRKTGILWWNLIDGWPQISDAVVDWYGTKKLAYHTLMRSQSPFAIMIDEPEEGKLPLFAVNDSRKTVSVAYTVKELSTGEEYTGTCEIAPDTAVRLCDLSLVSHGFYLITWQGDAEGINHFAASQEEGWELDRYVSFMKECGLYEKLEGFDL